MESGRLIKLKTIKCPHQDEVKGVGRTSSSLKEGGGGVVKIPQKGVI